MGTSLNQTRAELNSHYSDRLLGVIFDQVCGLCLAFDVRCAPKATEAGTGPGSLCLAERL